MLNDHQVRKLFMERIKKPTISAAAASAGVSERAARKYLKMNKLPSEVMKPHDWKTREDAFEEVWEEVREKLDINPGLQAKTLFWYLQRKYEGRFDDGQLRTLQRRVKAWRATEGPSREVFFDQEHHPGRLCQSDFTNMNKLCITINGAPFNHLLYHLVLTYSNWEAVHICYSESFESLSEGFQSCIWKLGGVPESHQTDQLSTAVNKAGNMEEFTDRYKALLSHYKINGRKIQVAKANENGDVEQRHHRFKIAVDQSLMLRGSRDFISIEEYRNFLTEIERQLNSGRQKRFAEEVSCLKKLPNTKLDSIDRIDVKVRRNSTISVKHNIYSVNSRLIGEKVRVQVYENIIKVYYGQKLIDQMPRLRGDGNVYINYRHMIDWLVRKPGAFENYKYRRELFPTINFRICYDCLKEKHTVRKASKIYLSILEMAAKESEDKVDVVLSECLDKAEDIVFEKIAEAVNSKTSSERKHTSHVSVPDLKVYDSSLLENTKPEDTKTSERKVG